jgi:transposase
MFATSRRARYSRKWAAHIKALESRIAGLHAELLAMHKTHPVRRLLAEIPGVGPVIVASSRRQIFRSISSASLCS